MLSLLLRADNAGPGDSVSIALQSDSHTLTLTPTLSGVWQHVWGDAGALAGQTITLTIGANDAGSPGLIIMVDEVTLGPTVRGVYTSWLPVARR